MGVDAVECKATPSEVFCVKLKLPVAESAFSSPELPPFFPWRFCHGR
jgi:hypothetical protein